MSIERVSEVLSKFAVFQELDELMQQPTGTLPAFNKLAEGECVVGELTPFERACCILSEKYVMDGKNKTKTLCESHTTLAEVPVEQITNLEKLVQDVKILDHLKWSSIHGRHGTVAAGVSVGGLGIRAGGVIVTIPKREEVESPFGGIMSICIVPMTTGAKPEA